MNIKQISTIVGVIVLMLRAPGAVSADLGVGINLGDIAVSDELEPGRTYHLPQLVVANPGTETADYRMTVDQVAITDLHGIDPTWATFAPSTFTLEPGSSQPVSVQLDVPPETRSGQYLGYLKAEVVPRATSVSIGPAAGTKLTFTVAERAGLAGVVAAVREAITGWWPWPELLLAIVAIGSVAWLVWRRWSFRVERR